MPDRPLGAFQLQCVYSTTLDAAEHIGRKASDSVRLSTKKEGGDWGSHAKQGENATAYDQYDGEEGNIAGRNAGEGDRQRRIKSATSARLCTSVAQPDILTPTT